MSTTNPLTTEAYTLPPQSATATDHLFRVTEDVAGMTTLMVNLYLVGTPGSGDWVLVDAGLPGFSGRLLEAVEARFHGRPPKAIVLTHGHFDHVGMIRTLLGRWPGVIVYAHSMELPYLTGRADYPPPDPTVGGGMLARTSPLLPRRGIDLGERVMALPPDGSVPPMPGWRAVPTPGHTAGHISLFRDSDRLLIAGDAFVTQKQESLMGVLTQARVMHGPPMYFTEDWGQAAESVRRLEALGPDLAATGHGLPMGRPRLADELGRLARDFEAMAVPRDGRYVREPVRHDLSGAPSYIPPPTGHPLAKFAGTMAFVGLVAGAAMLLYRRRD